MGLISSWSDFFNTLWSKPKHNELKKELISETYFEIWLSDKIYKKIIILTWYSFLAHSQSIDDDKCNHTTFTLHVAFLNILGEANSYIRFRYSPQTIFYHNQGQVSGSMNSDPINQKTQVNNQQSKSWSMKLKFILHQSKQSIDINKYEHLTCTLSMTFLKPAGEANTYLKFVYVPQNKSIKPEDTYQDQ